jgi:hypothetical protein
MVIPSRRQFDLRELLLDMKDLSDEDLEQTAKDLYSECFLQNAINGIHRLHDGDSVIFKKARFQHAFYLAANWQESRVKTGIDIRRVERMKWILPMLGCDAPNVECWLVPSDGVIKRVYVCFALGYLIWLEPGDREGQWSFSSAYTNKAAAIREYLKGGKRIWPVKK